MVNVSLVDDHVLLRNGLAAVVDSFDGYTVAFEADNGQHFLEQLSHNKRPHIVLLDISMPVMDGFGFLGEFEKLPDSIKNFCKVIVLSSSISAEDINRASTNQYVRKYLNKPLNEKYLSAVSF